MATDNHGYGEQQADDADWHIPIEANWDKIEVDVEVRDVAANRGNYQPWDGAKFLATDTGERFVGNGTSWIDVDLTAPSVDTEQASVNDQFNNIRWATSIAEIQAHIDTLPQRGGVIRLVPGSYDWNQTITFPSDYSQAQWTLDMRGSEVVVSSYDGGVDSAYIYKPSGTANSCEVHIFGPNIFDVTAVTDPGDVMHLWDVENSYIHFSHVGGPVDAILRKNAANDSGHHCQIHANGFGMQKGFVIGDQTGAISCDRSHWRGQLTDIEDVGVHIVNGQTHHFWVQPETGKSGFSSTGYLVEKSGNYFWNNHGKTSVPFDIRADANVRPPRFQKWETSKFATRPHGFVSDRIVTHLDQFFFDGVGSGKYNTANATNGSFGLVNLNGGTTDGTVAHLQTPNRGGNSPQIAHTELIQNQVNSSTIRFGVYDSATNWVALERSPSDTNWQAVAVEGGTETYRNATTHAVNGNIKELTVNWNPQTTLVRLGILDVTNDERRYVVDDPTLTTNLPATVKPRLWLTTNGTPATAQKIQAEQFNLAMLD